MTDTIVFHKTDHARLRVILDCGEALLCEEVDSQPKWYIGPQKHMKPRRVSLRENLLLELPVYQTELFV